MINTFNKDPLYCYICNKEMILESVVLPPLIHEIYDEHENIGNGFYSY